MAADAGLLYLGADQLAPGHYEKLRTVGLDRAVGDLGPEVTPEFSAVDKADAPEVIARHVAEALRRLLAYEGTSPDAARHAGPCALPARLTAPDVGRCGGTGTRDAYLASLA